MKFNQGERIHADSIRVYVSVRLSRLALPPLSRLSSRLGTLDPTSSHQSVSITRTLSPSPPWQAWTLNQEFLHEVKVWNETHSENTIDRMFNGACTLIDRHKDLLELVPDGPIPIRGFVKALFHLVYLGAVRNPDRHRCRYLSLIFCRLLLRPRPRRFCLRRILWNGSKG